MPEPTLRRVLIVATTCLAAIASRPAQAQDPLRLPADFLVKRFDEWRLQRDQARLQNDLGQGDAVRVSRDLKHIQGDERRIWYDRRRIRRDMFLPEGPWAPSGTPIVPGAGLVPHPQYPGYGYDPSNPAQLYRRQPQAVALGAVPVAVVNAGQPGTAVDYLVDGIAHRIGGGQVQRLTVLPTSTILYDRGGGLGEQRYALSAGTYEFQPSDTGHNLYKLPTREEADRSVRVLVPRNELPTLPAGPSAVQPKP